MQTDSVAWLQFLLMNKWPMTWIKKNLMRHSGKVGRAREIPWHKELDLL